MENRISSLNISKALQKLSIQKTYSIHNIFNCYYQNVRGLNTKLKLLKRNVDFLDFNFLAFTETWLHNNVSSLELNLVNYENYRCDRSLLSSPLTRGGGVLIAVKKNVSPHQLILM